MAAVYASVLDIRRGKEVWGLTPIAKAEATRSACSWQNRGAEKEDS